MSTDNVNTIVNLSKFISYVTREQLLLPARHKFIISVLWAGRLFVQWMNNTVKLSSIPHPKWAY
jgi:hypothetical protein